MSNDQDLTAATEASWRGFRQRLADHVEAMSDDDVLFVEFVGAVEEHDDGGAAPYVQVCAFEETLVRVEAVSNAYLDPSIALSAEQEAQLVALGWIEPGQEAEGENFHEYFERRAADEAAVLLVRTLREVHGVPHPAFLDAAGLEVDPDVCALRPSNAAADDEWDEVIARVPRDHDHLHLLVDEALASVFPDLRHDDDGDVPIVCGQSLAFVRVATDRPCVEVFAEIVLDPTDLDRLPIELDLLNGEHPMWSFSTRGTHVRMTYELLAIPLAPMQLRMVVERFSREVDEIARVLALRVGGRRFLDDDPDSAPDTAVEHTRSDDPDPAILGLLELLHLGSVKTSTVAGLFDHDRVAVIAQLVRIRTGIQSCEPHDEETVLTALRRALRLISDGAERPSARPSRPRSIQPSLLSDDEAGESALDLGWSA